MSIQSTQEQPLEPESEIRLVEHDDNRGTLTSRSAWRLSMWGVIGISFLVMLLDAPRETVGVMVIVMMLGLIGIKLPIGAAMAIPALIGIWSIAGMRAVEGTLSRMPYEVSASWSLTVIPMFVLMGLMLFKSGLTAHIYEAARQWVGWLPGGLAVGTNVAGAGFASMSGSTLGSIFPLTRAGVPEMLKAGYDKRLAVGSVLATGLLGHLIPPSLMMVVYAGVVSAPIGPQLMAGLLPGILLFVMISVAIVVLSTVRPALAGGGRNRDVEVSWSERWRSLAMVWPVPILFVVVCGGIYGGFLTATEAGAAGALGATLIALVLKRKDRPLTAMGDALVSTAGTVGSLFFMIIGAHMFSRVLSVSGLADGLVRFITDIDMNRVTFLIVVGVIYLILGTFMDSLVIMLLTVPVLLPLFGSLGIAPIWFGVFFVIFAELAMITPPVGVLAYVLHGIVQDREVNIGQRIPLSTVFGAAMYVIPVPLLLVGLMIAFPELVMWIPDSMSTVE